MKTRNVTVSAISASFIIICLTLGAYVDVTDISMVLLSSLFVLMPIAYKSFKGGLFAYSVGGTVALLICIPKIATSAVFVAYFGFFGIFPVVNAFMNDKNVNKYVLHAIGFIWCAITVYGMYFYYKFVLGLNFHNLPLWVEDYILLILVAVVIVFYFVYAYLLKKARQYLAYYMDKIGKK